MFLGCQARYAQRFLSMSSDHTLASFLNETDNQMLAVRELATRRLDDKQCKHNEDLIQNST